jgi:hypothetical protein
MERTRRSLDLGIGRKLHLDESDFQRLESPAALEGWTPETWLRRQGVLSAIGQDGPDHQASTQRP